MTSAVLDTNALASDVVGFRTPESTPGELLRRWQTGTFTLFVSDHVLTELTRTFARPYFARRLGDQEIEEALATLRAEASRIPLTVEVVGVATQPKVDLVLAAAVSARADYLVTGDKQLQAIGSYQGVTIPSPRDFLARLEQEDASQP